MKMQQRDLEYFKAIASHGHLGRAAEELELSQPALSQSLRRLERAVKTKLVERTPKGVTLTRVGVALLANVERLRLAHDDVLREILEIGQGVTGNVRIGADTGWTHLLARACELLMNSSPGITIDIEGGAPPPRFEALAQGELDFVISSTPVNDEGLVEEIFHMEEFAVYASLAHRLAKRKEVTFEELSRERWALPQRTGGPFQRSVMAELLARGFSGPVIAMVSWEADVRSRLIAVTDLLGYSSRRFAEQAARQYPIKVLRVKGYSWSRACAVVYRKGGYLTPAARRLMEYLKVAAKEEAKR